MTAFTESTVEAAALAWLEAAGWQLAHGPDIAPDMPASDQSVYHLRFHRLLSERPPQRRTCL